MNILLYITIAFLVFFFMWKKYGHKTRERGEWESMMETTAFWRIVAATFFWPIAIPMMLAWRLLDKAYNKFTGNK